MMDRNAANSRMDHEAEGARAEWLSAMQSLVYDQATSCGTERCS